MKTLRGERNQCQGCKEYLNSNSAFDKHRVGEFGKDRLCRTPDEMTSLGMSLNRDGFWITKPMTVSALSNLSQNAGSDLNSELVPKHTPDVLEPENG